MRSSDREEAVAAYDALDAALDRVAALSCDALTTPEHFNLLQRCQTIRRRLPAVEHELITELAHHAIPAEIGGPLAQVLADRLRITKAEAHRRITDAEVLGPRRTLTGEPLQPRWPAAAAAQARGQIGGQHVREIHRFFKQLPSWVDEPTKAQAERDLTKLATEFRPDELRKAAERIAAWINPDGQYSDTDRARKRGLSIGPQDIDGMSPINGWLTPECRANFDAVLAKWAAPGMCNPDDPSPTVDAQPSEQTAERDDRTPAQRNHDALNAMCRSILSSGELGQHNGLPATVVVSTTLQELESAAGKAITGGGTWLPMRDVIRLAQHANHYLVVFDEHTNRTQYLAHTKRLANPDQRIVLYAKDRGCTHPGCTAPGYYCQAHHVNGWARTNTTNVDDLTLTCKPNHPLAEQGWITRKRADGTTEWIPPPHLDHGKPRTNGYFHPERYLKNNDDVA